MLDQSEYEKLRLKWYKKLEKEGFKDIETLDGRLIEYSSTLTANPKKISSQNGGWRAKQEYYRLASSFLLEYQFSPRNKLYKVMWEYHSQGMSARDIAAIFKKRKIKKIGRGKVWQVLKMLKEKMFIMYKVQSHE